MHNIGKLVRENKAEAHKIIKAFGGEISFIGGVEPKEFNGNPYKLNVPIIILDCAELVDCAVLAVRCGKSEGDIEFYGLDLSVPEASEWFTTSECANNTENEIYEFIGDNFFLDKNGKAIKVGEKVVWHDPLESARDLSRVWEVFAINGEVVSIADEYSEAEVSPSEIEIV